MADSISDRLRALPSVDRLLAAADELIALYGFDAVRDAIRDSLDSARDTIRHGDAIDLNEAAFLSHAANLLEDRFSPTLHPVINATGVIIHTNLGRAPLSQTAVAAMKAVAQGYSTLEFDMTTGKRGSRSLHAQSLITEVTGAEAALVVNNNAGATVLMLSALAQGHSVLVSRGELVEIGGGFRVPAIMAQSGARLVEVGTTNRTRIADFVNGIDDDTSALMRVHASNFKQVGFTEMADLAEMATLAHANDLLMLDDLGSGALVDTAVFGLDHEPTVQESLHAGCDVVAFSGDKLLGGPQAGILIGKKTVIDRLKRHPLARALRADKLCLAALSATLDHFRRGEAFEAIPVLRMIARPLDDIRATACKWAQQLGGDVDVIDSESAVGGGSLPGTTLPTVCIALDVDRPDDFLARLRDANPPVIARIEKDRVLFDPRTVLNGQEDDLLSAIRVAR